jgi:hypothetical protein
VVEISPKSGNSNFKGGIKALLNTWCYIHHITLKDISGSTSTILLEFEGADCRLSNIKLYGSKRAVLAQYNASLIGWDISIYDPTAANASAFKIWANSKALLWYGINIYNENGNENADGIYAGGNSSIQINYANFEIERVKLAIQAQWGGIIYYNNTGTIQLKDCPYGIRARDYSFLVGDKEPEFTNVPTQYSDELNTILIDGSYTLINRKDFKVINGFNNKENGTALLMKSTPENIQNEGDKSIPTLEYLLSEEFGNSLPTSDPGVSGKIWNDSGILKISV